MDELRRSMGHRELIAWAVYFGRKAQREEMARKKAEGRG